MMSCAVHSEGTSSLDRHCAFCLKEISLKAIKKCGKCLKRAYCSKECQNSDWSRKKNGQGHKNWCGIDCGEEDVDWAVCPIAGKGLGIMALRDIPATYRIIVEAGVDKTHPRVAELMPIKGSLDAKYALNKLGCGAEDDVEELLCLRISRANHACKANAAHIYDKSVKVKILFSLRDIKKGEEICISYVGFDDLSKSETPEMSRRLLQSKWGIFCDQNCSCFDRLYFEKVEKARELDKAIYNLGSSGKTSQALVAVEKLLKLERQMNMSAIIVTRTLYDGFQIAITKRHSLTRGVGYITEVYDCMKRIKHPEQNEQVRKYKGFMENPSSHTAYLLIDELK